MDLNFLEFEQPIAELEAKIDELRYIGDDSDVNSSVMKSPSCRSKSCDTDREYLFETDSWQISQLARHPQRPYTLDYIIAYLQRFPGVAR